MVSTFFPAFLTSFSPGFPSFPQLFPWPRRPAVVPSVVGLRLGEGEALADGVERSQQPAAAAGVALAPVGDVAWQRRVRGGRQKTDGIFGNEGLTMVEV